MNNSTLNTNVSLAGSRPHFGGMGGMPTGRRGFDPDYYVLTENIVKLVKIVCYMGICPGMIIAGIVMNTICFVLFWKAKAKTSIIVFLLTLSVTDVIYNIAAAVHVMLLATEFYNFPFTMDQRLRATPYFYSCIRLIPGRFGALLTLAISSERMLSVVYPIKIRQISKKRNAIITVIVLFFTTVGCHAPMSQFNTTKRLYINATKSFVTTITPTEFGKNKNIVDLIYSINEILFNFIPVLGVMISCGITAFVVHSTAKLRTKMTNKLPKAGLEMQVTRTLLVLIFIFIICKAPGTILSLIIFIKMKPYKYTSNVYEVAMSIAYIPLVINSVVNLLIYYKTSTVYRKQIKQMFGFQKEKQGGTSTLSDKRFAGKSSICTSDDLDSALSSGNITTICDLPPESVHATPDNINTGRTDGSLPCQ